MEAIITVDLSDFRRWERAKATLLDVCHELMAAERKAAKSTDQIGDAVIIVVDNDGWPTLKLGAMAPPEYSALSMSFYDRLGRVGLIDYNEKLPTERDVDRIMINVSQGKRICNECGGWKTFSRMHTYSFAGVVCNKCFDPKKHKQADTRGD